MKYFIGRNTLPVASTCRHTPCEAMPKGNITFLSPQVG